MDENKVEGETLETQVEAETPTETAQEEQVDIESLKKQAELAQNLAQNYKIRAEKAEAALKKTKPVPEQVGSSVDPVGLVRLGKNLQEYSDDELDFVLGFAKSRKPEDILEAAKNPFVQAGIQAQREKVDKEKTLKPSGGQPEVEVKKSNQDILRNGTLAEKEELLKKLGVLRDTSFKNRK